MKLRLALLATLSAVFLIPVAGLAADAPHGKATTEKTGDDKNIAKTDDDKPLENPVEDAQPRKRSIPFPR